VPRCRPRLAGAWPQLERHNLPVGQQLTGAIGPLGCGTGIAQQLAAQAAGPAAASARAPTSA
jgi:hypothetical protein